MAPTTHPARPEPVEGLSFFSAKKGKGFDKLSPNGWLMGWVRN